MAGTFKILAGAVVLMCVSIASARMIPQDKTAMNDDLLQADPIEETPFAPLEDGQPPINDDCPDAVEIFLGDTAFSNVDASTDGPTHAECQFDGQTYYDIWYTFTAPETGDLIVSTCDAADFDTDLVVYDGCDCGALGLLGCNDDFTSCAGYTSQVTVPVVTGNCYLIRVGCYNATTPTGTGTLSLTFVVPPTGACCVDLDCVATNTQPECDALGGNWYAGEDCATYVCGECDVDYCVDAPYAGTMSTTCGMGNTCALRASEDVEFRVAVPHAGTWIFSLCGSAFDTYMYLGSSRCSSDLGENDDSCGLQSEIEIYIGSAMDVYCTVEAYSDTVCGDYILNVTEVVYPPGACCVAMECVGDMTQPECDILGGRFFESETCDNFECPESIVDCPTGTLAGQTPPDPDGDWTFANGDADANGTNYLRAESFADLTGTVYDIHWWGLWAYNSPSWAPCVESDPTMEIKFYADAGGQPGAVVCSYTVIPTWVPTGEIFGGLFDMLYFSVDLLDPPCVINSGWVSIQGFGDATCWFLWASSYVGDGSSFVNTSGTPGFAAYDLSYCLTGQYVPLFGACCDDLTSTCVDNVEIIDCDGRFAADTLCDNLDPACGQITGACCYDDGTCEILTEAACTGMWLGAWTTCDMCPCIVPCPPGAVAEIEPCGDDANGGCNMDIPTFNPITPDVPVCGTIWADAGTRDTDWYEIVVTTDTVFTWTVEAEFDGLGVVAGMVETSPPGNPDCSTASSLNPYATGGECAPISVTTTCLPAGTYWFFVSALDYYGLPCGSNNDYVATLTATECVVMGACCYNDGFDCVDSTLAECDALAGEWWMYETCAEHECRRPCIPGEEATIDIIIHTDNYPSETTWEVTNNVTGQVVCAGGPYDSQQYTYEERCCVPLLGCWDFTIYDAWGDGICCAYGEGYYEVYFESELICSGGEFGTDETCAYFGDNCVPPEWACCLNDVCIGDMTEDLCLGQGGTWVSGQRCDEGYDCSCIVDFCVDAPFYGEMLTTCGAGNDCDLRTTEEHEYQVTLPEDGVWTFSLCGSAFDTYLYVGTTRCGQEVGANDDFCGLQSEITATVTAGVYYVTVEGYSGCGEYVLNVTMLEECDVTCPPGGTPEGEPDCYENYEDVINGGCNSDPFVFSPITCNETICGTSGTYVYYGSSYRDTDWFEIELPAATTLTWDVCASFPVQIFILDANQGGCSNIVVSASASGSANVLTTCQASVAAGTYWLWVGPSTFSGVTCGSAYVATLTADPDVCMCGDFDNDNDVDVDDFYFFLDAYGTCVGDIKYEDVCDFDGDECITLVDYQAWMQCYRDANDGKRFVVPRTRLNSKAGARPAGQAQPL